MTSRQTHAPGRCRALLAELFDYLDGELSLTRCRTLERHLDGCPCCGELAQNLRKAMLVCRAEGRRQLPTGVRSRARQRIQALLDLPAATQRPPAKKASTRKRTATARGGSAC